MVEVSLFADRTRGRGESYRKNSKSDTLFVLYVWIAWKSEEQEAYGFKSLCMSEVDLGRLVYTNYKCVNVKNGGNQRNVKI